MCSTLIFVEHIENIMKLEEGDQTLIVNAIQGLMGPSSESPQGHSLLATGPPSFHPQHKALMEQLENISAENDNLTVRCNELDIHVNSNFILNAIFNA